MEKILHKVNLIGGALSEGESLTRRTRTAGAEPGDDMCINKDER